MRYALNVLLLTLFGLPLMAAGQVSIAQAKALSGGISGACDAPGFPITICVSGSYKLESDLEVPANTDGIDIAVPNVTIDLNGFTISGRVTCTGAGTTLHCSGSTSGGGIQEVGSFVSGNITVRHGTVRGFGLLGVGLTGIGNIVDEVNASENMATGIFVWYGTVTRSTSSRNLGAGFVCYAGQVKDSAAYGNTFGILLNRCSATDNAVNYNAQYGISGFHSLISGNELDSNALGDLFNEVGLVSSGDNSCTGVSC
jgi:hypothetical protein